MGMSSYLKNAMISHFFRNSAVTPPTTLYLALYTSDPAAGGNEVSGGAYARQTVALTSPTNGVSTNSAEIEFPTPTAYWGTVTHAGILDALTGGNLFASEALSESQTIQNGSSPLKIPVDQLSFTLT